MAVGSLASLYQKRMVVMEELLRSIVYGLVEDRDAVKIDIDEIGRAHV